MTTVSVIKRDGTTKDVRVQSGKSLMENLRHGGIDEILALCGGVCACATCHLYVDMATELPDMSDGEKDMLDTLVHQKDGSRLSCQITVSDGLSDFRVEIAPEE